MNFSLPQNIDPAFGFLPRENPSDLPSSSVSILDAYVCPYLNEGALFFESLLLASVHKQSWFHLSAKNKFALWTIPRGLILIKKYICPWGFESKALADLKISLLEGTSYLLDSLFVNALIRLNFNEASQGAPLLQTNSFISLIRRIFFVVSSSLIAVRYHARV